MTATGGDPDTRRDVAAPLVFLRFDPPELQDGSLVVRAVPSALRERRRLGVDVPLGYLYEPVDALEPDTDLSFDAGHYDEANLVWSFSGEVTGIAGMTEPLARETPARKEAR